jgi:hypothetical protein
VKETKNEKMINQENTANPSKKKGFGSTLARWGKRTVLGGANALSKEIEENKGEDIFAVVRLYDNGAYVLFGLKMGL